MRALVFSIVASLAPCIACSHAALQSFSVTTTQGSSNEILVNFGAGEPRAAGAGTTWPVSVNLALLAAQPASLVVSIPDRASITLSRRRSNSKAPGRITWAGEGDGCVAVFDAWPPNQVVGTISCLSGNYGVAVADDGNTYLTRYDSLPGAVETQWEGQNQPPKEPVPSQEPSNSPAQIDSSVDIMVLYTEAVRQHFDPSGGNVNTVGNIEHYVNVLQEALDDSSPIEQMGCGSPSTPTIAQVQLVATKKVSRVENGDDFEEDLIWMSDLGDEVYALRQFWRADVVIYLTEDVGSVYGQSRQPKANGYPAPGPDFMRYANSVVMRSHALNDDDPYSPAQQPFVFMHEFAHTIGADHNIGNAVNPPPNGVELWSYGHFANDPDTGQGARTIMSYYAVPDCASSANGCIRVLHYSNASICDDWFRTGVRDQQENARTIAHFASYAADYTISLGRIFYDGFEP